MKDQKPNAPLTTESARIVAKLACLRVQESELQAVTEKLNSILGYVSRLDAVNVTGVEPMSQVHGTTNVFRADQTAPSLPVQDLLAMAPSSSGRFIKVPLVVEDA